MEEETFSAEAQIDKTYFFFGCPQVIGELKMKWICGSGKYNEPLWDWKCLEYVYVRGAMNEVLARYKYKDKKGRFCSVENIVTEATGEHKYSLRGVETKNKRTPML